MMAPACPKTSRTGSFGPFFTTRATGTGLGLAVVQRIVGAHGGVLSHHETPGGGATFEVELPLRHPHRAADALSGRTHPDSPRRAAPPIGGLC